MMRNLPAQELKTFLSNLEQQIVDMPCDYQGVSEKFELLRAYLDHLVTTTREADTRLMVNPSQNDLFPFQKSFNESSAELSGSIVVLDPTDQILFANQKVTSQVDKNLSELVGRSVWEIFPSLAKTALHKHLSIVKETHMAASVRQPGETADVWYEIHMYPVQEGIVLLWTEYTDEKSSGLQYERIYQEFKETRDLLQQSVHDARFISRVTHEANIQTLSIFNNLIAVAVLQEQNGVIQMANSFAIALFGFDPLRLTSDTIFQRLQVRDENGVLVAFNDLPTAQSAQGSVVQNRKLCITNPRGRTYTVLVSSMPMQTGKKITGVVSVWNDITRQERLLADQRRIEEQRAENVIQLEVQRRLLEHREYERQEIARDIHDGPIQSMVSNLFNLQRTKESIQDPATQKIITEVFTSIKNSVQDLRDVVNELRPPVVLHLGLSRAIHIHTQDIQTKYPDLTFHLDLFDDEKLLPENTCLALYRIYQESLNNIIRHAQASEVSIYYTVSDQRIILEIKDNGRGFIIPTDWTGLMQRNHFGLPGMSERAEAIGGHLLINSEPGRGTQVRVEIPQPADAVEPGQ